MKLKPELERLTEAACKRRPSWTPATRTALNMAAKRLMMAQAELKRSQAEPRVGASRGSSSFVGLPV